MENKKVMIPIILGVLLLCGIIFTVVYKNTSGQNPNDQPEVQTLAPKETEPIETRISTDESNKALDGFDVNETQAVHGQDLNELAGGSIFANNKTESETNTINENQEVETLSDEEMQKAMEEQVALQYTRPYNSELDKDKEVYSDEELESIANETVSDLSKYEMDTSYLDDPEKVQEILRQMGY